MADMEDDGFSDIVFLGDRLRSQEAIVVWGSAEGIDPEDRTQLSARHAQSNNVADLNLDGWLELIISNHQENFDHGAAGTDILWGSPKG